MSKRGPNLKKFGKPKKEVAAKVLREKEGMTYSQIGEWLGISDDTARRYAMIAKTPDSLQEFEVEFSKMVKGMQYEGIHAVHKRLSELVPNERKISEVVKAGEFYQGGAKSGAPNINVNIANILDKERETFNLDE